MKFPWHGLSPEGRRSLLCHALYWQAMSMAFTFVNIYLFRLGGGYASPALYQIWTNALIPFGFLLGAALARRRGSAAAYRAGLLLHELFLVIMLLLRERCMGYLPWVGALAGLAAGMYWQGWILMMVDQSDDANRDAMLGSQQWVYFVAGLSGAPLAGWFLSRFSDLEGYNYVFALSTLLFAAAWLISLPVRTKPMHGAGSFLRLLKARKPPGWGPMNLSAALMGLMSVSALFLAALIAYESKGNETGTGSYTFVNAGLGFVAAWMMARVGKPSRRLRTLWIAAVAVAAITLPLAFHRSFAVILLYGAGMAIALSFYNVPLLSTHLRFIDVSPRFKARRADALCFREFSIMFGRVAGFSFVLFMVGNADSKALAGLFVAIALAPLLNTYAIRRYV